MGMRAPVTVLDEAQPAADWREVKARVVAGLDVAAEYSALGLRFAGPAAPNGWRPCHAIDRPDENPSAAVHIPTGVYHDLGGDGAVMGLLDFALRHGGETLGLGQWVDVVRHYARKAGVPVGRVERGSHGRVLEAVYHYRDRAGEIRYGVFRYRLPNGRKDFRQYPMKVGGWHKAPGCMEGVEPLPYRLPELLAADPAETVFVLEGEKDCDRAAELGLVATTNHQGAQSTDRTWPHFAGLFAGRSVAVVPDNDPPGRRHAARVAELLHAAGAAVRVVDLAGVPAKGDLSDWLDLGHTAGELRALAAAAPAYSGPADFPPAGDGGDEDRVASVADVRGYLNAEGWAWPLWMPNGAITIVAAEPGTGKTRFVFDLLRRCHLGLPWPDGAPTPESMRGRPWLWVAADHHHQDLCDLAREYGVPDDAVRLNAPAADPFDGTHLETADDFAALEARAVKVGAAVVVVDTINNAGDYKVEDARDSQRLYKPLQEMAVRLKTPLLCVTHLNAGGKVLGRRAAEKARVVVMLNSPDPEGQPARRKLWVDKSKAVKPPPLGVTMGDGGNQYDGEPPAPQEEPARRVGGATRGRPPAQTLRCAEWLRGRLALLGGRARVSVLRREIERNESEEDRWGASTIYKARDHLGLEETEDDDGKKWWSLPGGALPPAAEDDDTVPF